MFNHLFETPTPPKRVVILGAKGFVGSMTAAYLLKNNIDIVTLGREEIDLCDETAAEQLIKILRPDDVLLVISAKAPYTNDETHLRRTNKTACTAGYLYQLRCRLYRFHG